MKKCNNVTRLGLRAIQKYLSTLEEDGDRAIYSRQASEISLSIISDVVFPGDMMKIRVAVSPTIANTPNLIWLSSDPSIISVDELGNIVAYKNGDVIISALDSNNPKLSASLSIHVGEEEVPKALKFMAAEDSTLGLTRNGTSNPNIEYSQDGKVWSEFNETVEIPSGESIYVRGNNPAGISTSSEDYSCFVMTGSLVCEGNIMHLLSYTEDLTTIPGTSYCFYKLFSECTALTTAPKLPATVLGDYCYDGLFYGCTSLSAAPELASTSLSNFCYREMFYGCESLLEAPDLPATIVPVGCYNEMFCGCHALEKAPDTLPALLLSEFCYAGMFSDCTVLENAPKLPALGLVENCYNNMFNGCSGLNNITALFTTEPSEFCTMSWVEGVAEIGSFTKNSSATWEVTGSNGVPEGWLIKRA